MDFDAVLEQVTAGGECTLSADWGQGRASFGGAVVAMVYAAMQQRLSGDRPLRALATSFVGPVAPDVPFTLEVEVLREGKAVTQCAGRLIQNGEVQCMVLGSFGAGRVSSVSVAAETGPVLQGPEGCQALPFIPGVTPAFTQHIDMRWAIGHMPFTGKGGREMGGWMRFRDTPRALTDAHIIALVDCWPPAVLPHVKGPAPASSLSWTLELVHPGPVLAPDDWLAYRACIDQARDGYGHTEAGIWNAQGELVALSRQTVTVFG